VPALEEALRGQDAVVSVIGVAPKLEQKVIIDAAVAAGVRRFIPSEFGNSPSFNGLAALAPIREMNQEVIRYAREKAATTPSFSWTAIAVGVFIDLVRSTALSSTFPRQVSVLMALHFTDTVVRFF
jgi:hypothetical protein